MCSSHSFETSGFFTTFYSRRVHVKYKDLYYFDAPPFIPVLYLFGKRKMDKEKKKGCAVCGAVCGAVCSIYRRLGVGGGVGVAGFGAGGYMGGVVAV